MKKFVLIVLIVLNLVVAIVFSPYAQSAQLSLATTSPVPGSPLPPPSGSHGSDSSHEAAVVSSDAVWLLQTEQSAFHIKTHQSGVGWWDANGQLHVAPQVNGLVNIPLSLAVMISIPGDAAGVPAPPGWRKLMRPENGEWVIVRVS